MMMGLVMVGAVDADDPGTRLSDVTPIARLVGETELIAAPPDAPYDDVAGFVEVWAADPAAPRSPADRPGASRAPPTAASRSAPATSGLAVSTAERSGRVPDVPTLVESGFDVEVSNWRGLMARPGMSGQAREDLTALVADGHDTREWADAVEENGGDDLLLTGDEYGRLGRGGAAGAGDPAPDRAGAVRTAAAATRSSTRSTCRATRCAGRTTS